jgi:DnaD/phage-associated family protein
MKGWISIHRQIRNHWIWQDRPFDKRSAWIDLLLSANHDDNKVLIGNILVDVNRGSFITSEVKLAERWGWTRKTVRCFLDVLIRDNMLTKKGTSKYTTVTIVNYGLYQLQGPTKDTAKGQQRDSKGPALEQQRNTNNNVYNSNNENNEEEEEERIPAADISKIQFVFEGEGFGMIGPTILDDINEMLDKYHIEPSLIIEALKKAKRMNKTSWSFASAIIARSYEKGITTLEQFQADQAEFQNKKSTAKGYRTQEPIDYST